MRRRSALAAIALGCVSCVGTTGGDLFTFDAVAMGPADAAPGLAFDTGRGYRVTLSRARLHVGAVYLNRAMPTSGAQATSCVLPGTYLAQVTRGVDVDLLSPAPTPFPEPGEAVSGTALAGEVWLHGGDVAAEEDATPILDVAGEAEKDGARYPFEGTVTIGSNRAVPVTDPAFPGRSPMCKERIVSPIALRLPVSEGGRLALRVDPRGFFTNVDFAKLERVAESPPRYRFRDDSEDQPSRNLYEGLRARQGVYAISFTD